MYFLKRRVLTWRRNVIIESDLRTLLGLLRKEPLITWVCFIVGAKQELLEKMMLEQVTSEVDKEFNPDPEPTDYNSVTHKDFDRPGFESVKPSPTAVSMPSVLS